MANAMNIFNFKHVTIVTSILFTFFILAVVLGIVVRSSPQSLLSNIQSEEIRFAFLLGLLTVIISTLLCLAISIPTAYAIARYRFFGTRIAKIILDLPIAFPPIVAGLGLLILFGTTPFGMALEAAGLKLIFTPAGIVLAQFFVNFDYHIYPRVVYFRAVWRRKILIRIEDLTVDLGEFILKDMNLEIKRGEYFVVLGPTGSGKSVLLETIAGLYQAKKGLICINGQDVTREEPRKRNISIVYQDYMLFPHLTVKENIRFGLKEKDSSDFAAVVEFLDIRPILHRRPDTLSGGESQRVALARALVTKPAVLLLDEPLAALDISTREKIMRELRQINKKMGITIIHITHERSEAIVLADRIAVLNAGQILQVGTPEAVFRKPYSEFVANFVGVENLFKGKSVNDTDTGIAYIDVNGILIVSTSCKSGDVFISIRPEDILVATERIETSARNTYRGEITELIDRGAITKIEVDVGISFVVVITKRSFEDLALREGMLVYITFKASAVHVF